MIPYGFELRQQIVTNLHLHSRRQHALDARKHAAVAIVLVDDSQLGACFLLCRRASRLNTHAGQWALPGGRLDPGEDALAAALREVDEELGLRLEGDALVGWLDDYPTRSGYVITPVVLWAGGAPGLTPSPHEVMAVHRIPLHELHAATPKFLAIPESDRPVVQVPLGGFDIHAPTGAVLYQFRQVALAGRIDERVDHLEQPVFAWR
ncbi:MAG TPA: CoA pyrophosphatase [Ilumatobacter sp.]|nr:CoA pyrophosphatase [Ilumatobacter sp.]